MRFGGIVVAAVVLLGACSSDPAPKEPTGTPPTTSAAPTRTLPTMPPQALEDSSEGAAAFVKHYVDVFNYAAATGDVQELSRLSAPDCEGCQSYIAKFEQIYENGDRISVQLWTMPTTDVIVSGATTVTATIDVDEGEPQRYQFNFQLPVSTPFQVENITFEVGA